MLRKLAPALAAVALLLNAAASLPTFGQTLHVAMTASDIPTTTGIPNNGGEGFRFLGFPAFDGLINWDFTRPDQIAGLTSGLAASWKIDESDHTRWVFLLAVSPISARRPRFLGGDQRLMKVGSRKFALTLPWREPDSNRPFRAKRPGSKGLMLATPGVFRGTDGSTKFGLPPSR